MKRSPVLASLAALAIGAATTAATASAHRGPHGPAAGGDYVLTVTNTTEGQPLSPPFVAVHHRRADFWSYGQPASAVVAGIAEDADNGPAIELANRLRGVRTAFTAVDSSVGSAAPIGPGASQTYRFSTTRFGDRLTLLSMLVNTNDAFTGLDTVRLPRRVGKSVTIPRRAYDAGSEVNNELAAYIPGPVGGNAFVRDPEGNLIRTHPGVVGGHDLDPVTHSVSGRVATITIKRVR